MTPVEWGTVIAGAGTVGGIVVKLFDRMLSRPVDAANAEKMKAEAKQTAQATASSEVNTLREVIAEVRSSEAAKSARIDALEQRLDLLEERERHMLTRAAVHEAWDTLAFNFIAAQDPTFHPPPPLSLHRNPEDEGPPPPH